MGRIRAILDHNVFSSVVHAHFAGAKAANLDEKWLPSIYFEARQHLLLSKIARILAIPLLWLYP